MNVADNKSIETVESSQCSGCAACCNICPLDAISMEFDTEGFLSPLVSATACTHCGMCLSICPAIAYPQGNDPEPSVFAAKATSPIIRDSTSGGVYAVLAEHILGKGGFVCGAAYNDRFEVEHLLTNDPATANRIKQSKYVQSNPGKVYREIKKLLDNRQYVLFSGCPCQVAGLTKFLKQKYDTLYTLDIVCHGAPSPGNWSRYLKENIDTANLQSINFRHKGNHGFKKLHICFNYKNGSEKIIPSSKNPFFKHFLNNLGLRNACADCEGAVIPRQGDFSAGDFWGAEKWYPELVDNNSELSILFLNNNHSHKLFQQIKDKFVLLKEITPEQAMTSNRRRVRRSVNPNRTMFFDMLKYRSFADSVELNKTRKHYDIAICGATIGQNFGGLITYYALYRAVKKMGYTVIMLNSALGKSESEKETHAQRFCNENIQLTEKRKLEDFHEYNELADTFLLGSDQVWNWSLFKGRKEKFYLDFVDNSKKKISYAASFGFDKPTVLKPEFKEYYPNTFYHMQRFDYISIREIEGVDICNNYYGNNAVHVLDPVFFLNAEEYRSISSKAKTKETGRYLAVYNLTPHENLTESFKFVAEQLKLPIVSMLSGNAKKFKKHVVNYALPACENLQVEEWLYNMQNSEFIMTDSYHCVCFSIIFRKPFILIQNSWAPSRIETLLSTTGLMDRWLRSPEDIYKNPELITAKINWDSVHRRLNEKIEFSKNWLQDALKAPKKTKPSFTIGAEPMDIRTLTKMANKALSSVFRKRKHNVIILTLTGKNKELLKELKLPGCSKADFRKQEWWNNQPVCTYIGDLSQNTVAMDHGAFSFSTITSGETRITAAAYDKFDSTQKTQCEISIEKSGDKSIYSICDPGLHILLFSKKKNTLTSHIAINFAARTLNNR